MMPMLQKYINENNLSLEIQQQIDQIYKMLFK